MHAAARQHSGAAMRRDGRAARRRDYCTSKHPRGETAAWRLHDESGMPSFARGGCVARRQHGETAAGARWLCGEAAARRDDRAAMKAAAAVAFGGGLSPNYAIRGLRRTAEGTEKTFRELRNFVVGLHPTAAAGRIKESLFADRQISSRTATSVASVPLTAFGRFGIVSSGSPTAHLQREKDISSHEIL